MPRKGLLRFSWILAALLLIAGLSSAQQARYDFIISGAHIVDGTGAPWVAGDIGITGDRIAAIGDLSKASSAKRVNAANLVVAPGFRELGTPRRNTFRIEPTLVLNQAGTGSIFPVRV